MLRKLPSQTYSHLQKVRWLFDRTTKTPEDCWQWTGTAHKVGYGKVQSWLHKSRFAHRAMYELMVSPIPTGFYVLHSCDNRLCINPAHLSVGTHSDNQADKVAKGRHNYKFSDDDIHQLQRFYSYGISRKELLRSCGISTFWFDKITKENRRGSYELKYVQIPTGEA